jgi:SAM-dependent methyltransferase
VKESNKKPSKPRLNAPQWQIPPGLTSGNFDYIRSTSIASKYDDFLRDNPLAAADGEILDRYLPVAEDHLPQRPIVADFGCGNGRSLLPQLIKGYQGLGIDMSLPMLAGMQDKASQLELDDHLVSVQCNLVEMESLATDCIDFGICMFSTLGMISGRSNRQRFLQHVRRMLKPGGRFIVHAHNAIYQLRHRHGFRWAASATWKAIRGKQEFGDRTATYRSINNMFIHSFRRGELKRDLQQAGFEIKHWHGIEPGQNQATDGLPWGSDFRMVGWIVVCE